MAEFTSGYVPLLDPPERSVYTGSDFVVLFRDRAGQARISASVIFSYAVTTLAEFNDIAKGESPCSDCAIIA